MQIFIVLIILISVFYVTSLIRDLWLNKDKISGEPGSVPLMILSSTILNFASTFGLPDRAIGAATLPLLKWADGKNLPGSLSALNATAITIISIGYLKLVDMPIWNLLVPMALQVTGAVITAPHVVKLPTKKIRLFVAAGLMLTSVMLLLSKLGLLPVGGEEMYLSGWKFVFICALAFVGGILNSMGIGSFPVMLTALYYLGLATLPSYAITMSCSAFSTPITTVQFMSLGCYNRKFALISAICGPIGVLFALKIVKTMDISILQTIMLAAIFISSVNMFYQAVKKSKST